MRRLLTLFDTSAGRVARYAFSAIVVSVLVWRIDWHQFTALQGKFSVSFVLLAVLAGGLTFPLHAWRWQLLLGAQGLSLSLRWTHVVTWIGNFYNAFLVGGLGGDASRAFYICRDAPNQRAAGLAATLLDRVVGLVVLLGFAALALLLKLESVARHAELRVLLILCAALSVGCVIAFLLLCREPPAWIVRRLGPSRAATVADILVRARATPGTLLSAVAISSVIWLLGFASTWLLARSVGLPLPFVEVCLAMAVSSAATVLPVSVGGHGIREGALLGMLALLGLLPDDPSRQLALLLAVLVCAESVLLSLLGGGAVLFARRLLPASAS